MDDAGAEGAAAARARGCLAPQHRELGSRPESRLTERGRSGSAEAETPPTSIAAGTAAVAAAVAVAVVVTVVAGSATSGARARRPGWGQG